MSSRGERFSEAFVSHPAIAEITSAPAAGFDQVERQGDEPEELRFERAVAAEALRRTQEQFPHAAPGYVDPLIRDAVRRQYRRLQAEDARHLRDALS